MKSEDIFTHCIITDPDVLTLLDMNNVRYEYLPGGMEYVRGDHVYRVYLEHLATGDMCTKFSHGYTRNGTTYYCVVRDWYTKGDRTLYMIEKPDRNYVEE